MVESATKKPPVKKPQSPPRTVKPAKPPTVPREAPAEAPKAPRPKKEGLRSPQVRLLQALSLAGKALSRKEMAIKAKVDVSSCVEHLGSMDDEKRKKNDEKHWPSLITLKHVKWKAVKEEDGTEEIKFEITADGKKALNTALKEAESRKAAQAG
jgi:hypothetical protein